MFLDCLNWSYGYTRWPAALVQGTAGICESISHITPTDTAMFVDYSRQWCPLLQGFYSPSGKMTDRQISLGLKAVRLGVTQSEIW